MLFGKKNDNEKKGDQPRSLFKKPQKTDVAQSTAKPTLKFKTKSNPASAETPVDAKVETPSADPTIESTGLELETSVDSTIPVVDKELPSVVATEKAKSAKSSFLKRKGKAPKPEKNSDENVSAGEKVNLASQLLSSLKAPAFLKPKDLTILTESESLGSVSWRITESGVEEVDIAATSALLSFSIHDMRYYADLPMKFSDAQNMAMSDIGECYFINQSETLNAIYASTARRVEGFSQVLSPGLMLIEKELSETLASSDKKFIVGVYLKDDQSGRSLLVLYYKNPISNEYTPAHITVNPTNVDFVISQFCSLNGLDATECDIYLLSNKDLLRVVKKYWLGYPREPEIYGLAVRKLVTLGIGISCVAAGFSCVYGGQAYLRLHSLKSESQMIDTTISQNKKKINEVLESSVLSFSKTQSLNTSEIFGLATKLWITTGTVVSEASLDRQTYQVKIPLMSNGEVKQDSPYAQLLKRDAPEGCIKDSIGFSGALNGVQVTYQCETLAGPLSSYRIN